MLRCKTKRQYLHTLQVIKYRHLNLQSSNIICLIQDAKGPRCVCRTTALHMLHTNVTNTGDYNSPTIPRYIQ